MPFPRSLGNPWTQQGITSDFTNSGITYSLSNRGGDYQSSPTFEFGAGANKATFKSSLRGTVKSINVSNVGAGYGDLPASITLPASGTGFDSSTPFFTDFNNVSFPPGYDVKDFQVVFTGNFTTQAAATVTINGEIDGIRMASGGNGFTSNPGEPAVTGGSGGSGAVSGINKFTSQWNVNISKVEAGTKFFQPMLNSAISMNLEIQVSTIQCMINLIREITF